MTQEEKTKAYDDALEKAKGHINSKGIGDTVDLCKYLFPELLESEDERIRKFLIDYFTSYKIGNVATKLNGYRIDDILAYLEKQKINTEGDFGRGYDCGYEACLNSHGAEWFEKQKEQKSAEVDESTKRINKNWMKQYFDEQKQEYPLTPDECIKPTEWSEVELTFRGEKIKVKRPFYRDDKGSGYSTTEQDDWVAWNALRAWAESHGHTPFDLYPRAEWSEEDEKMIDTIVSVLGQYIDYKAASGTGSGYAIPRYSKEIDWLKSLRPSPSWKPSEEQMKGLKFFLGLHRLQRNAGTTGWKEFDAVESLYKDLKKL